MKLYFIIIPFFWGFFFISFGFAQNEMSSTTVSAQQTDIPEVLPETFSSTSNENKEINQTAENSEEGDNFSEGNDINDPFRQKILDQAHQQYLNWPNPPKLREELLDSLKINRLEGKHIDLYTDMPLNDSIREIPGLIDAAVSVLCQYFQMNEEELIDWRVEAFLMKTKEPFEKLGALERVPNFPHGYSTGSRIFAMDHELEYYNHFLLTHELVHAFMYRTFGDLNPRWFSEGMAEYLGLHCWNDLQLQLGIIPQNEEQVEGFGRLGSIRDKVRQNDIPSLKEILNFVPAQFRNVETYAWSWAFVLFLDRHPNYHKYLQKMAYFMMFPDANQRFVKMFGNHWDQLENDWKSFLISFDYDFDFQYIQWDASPGKPLELSEKSETILDLSVMKNWQNSGVAVEKGQQYRLDAKGRYQIAYSKKMLPCEPNGITFDYYSGRPWGQLLAVVVPVSETGMTFEEYYQKRDSQKSSLETDSQGDDSYEGTPQNEEPSKKNQKAPAFANIQVFDKSQKSLFPWNEIVAFDSTTQIIVPQVSGTLYFKINVPVASFSQNKGTFKVRVQKRVPTP